MSPVFYLTLFNGNMTQHPNSIPQIFHLDAFFGEARSLCQSGAYGSTNFLASTNNYTSVSTDVLKLGVVFAVDDNQLVGALLFRVVLEDCEIEHIAVVEHKKRLGIGLGLMQRLEQLATSQDVKKIFLEVGVRNIGAQALYAKFGFLPIGKRTLYYHNSEDAIVMEKQL